MRIQDYCDVADGALRLRMPLRQFSRGEIVTDNRDMIRQLDLLERVGKGNVPLTILGEKGTGKDRIAQYAHAVSKRKNAPFIKTNCAYLPQERMHMELFGSASSNDRGLLSQASGGSIYIENVDMMTSYIQYKLMERIQATQGKPGDVRYMVCLRDQRRTSRGQGLTDQMLYYFNTMVFEVPPLRSRPEDILLLTLQQLQKVKTEYHIERTISPEVMSAMLAYDWPTNIRQLTHTVERMAFLSDDRVMDSVALLNRCLIGNQQLQTVGKSEAQPPEAKSLKQIMQDYEIMIINQYIERCGSLRKAAAALKSSPATLSRKITEHNHLPQRKNNGSRE